METAELSRYSLWGGDQTPPVLPAGKVVISSLDIGSIDHDALAPLPSNAIRGIFAKLDLESQHAPYALVVDAVSKSAGFSMDSRFPAVFDADAGKVSVWGWLPIKSISGLVRDPSVLRVEISGRATAADPGALGNNQSRMVLALQMPDVRKSPMQLTETFRRLSRDTGFTLERVIGVQKMPVSEREALIVSGVVPVSQINRLMGDAAVVKVMPSPDRGRTAWKLLRLSREARNASPLPLRILDDHPFSVLICLLLIIAIPGLSRRNTQLRRR